METKKQNKFALFTIIGIFAIAILLLTDILIGMSDIGFKEIIDSIFNYSGSKKDLIITTVRLPRVLLCILVGASMVISGLIMQSLTRNPLASPQVLGINAGATLAVVIIMVFFPLLGYKTKILGEFLGAGVIGLFVHIIGSVKNLSPIKITLVGISIQLFLSSITKAIMLFNESKTSDLVFWMIGGVHHAQFTHVFAILPWFIVSIVLITIISNSMDILKMGDSAAISLSGCQRQRAWIAMALTQDTEVLLLDESTTYLDLAYQIEILELLKDLNKKTNKTIVIVIHELNQAARYADNFVCMKKGSIYSQGRVETVFTENMLKDVF